MQENEVLIRNKCMDYKKNEKHKGFLIDDVPKGISNAPFIWSYFGQLLQMNFYGGFMMSKVDESKGTVEADFVWVIERLKEDNVK